MIIKFTIPDEVANFIKDELKIEPKTYLQNNLIQPIIKKYEDALRTKKVSEAKAEVDTTVAKVKNDMRIELTEGELKRKR